MLEHLKLFALIVERGGMAAAGRELGLSPATVSARLAALEEHYRARLLNRTTRSLSLTNEGAVLLDGARQIIADMQALDARVRLGSDRLSGIVRITAPVDLGRSWLVPMLDEFLASHPDLVIDLHLSDGYVNLAGAGFDLALRYGALRDSTLRIRKLAEVRRVVCAAPSYVEQFGTPGRPEDLKDHNCLLMRFGTDPDHHWPFVADGRDFRVAVSGDRIANDGELVRRWCLEGFGIAFKSDVDVGPDLKAGRLIPLLTEYLAEPTELQLVYPGGRSPARRIRALVDHLVEGKRRLTC